ncbi:MAG TPA: FGGY-family carbohydrate kinase [Acidobacteriaceae bacterium]
MSGSNLPSLVAIDLGAESCRVSLLTPGEKMRLVHRFANAPVSRGESLMWDIDRILSEIEIGLRRCAEQATDPIASIGVDGWAVDYVRLGSDDRPLGPPFCYRDLRTEATLAAMESRYSREKLFALSGAQPLRINTQFQLMADQAAGMPASTPWINLPEYVFATLGGRRVAEYTNATHTGLVDMRRRAWCPELFELSGLEIGAAPPLVTTGTDVGALRSSLASLPALSRTRLIATACHDTASAVAAIPLDGEDWAYISSGTWSLVGALIDQPVTTPEACAAGFTNQGAAGDRICFHKNVNGMWLLKQTIAQLCPNEQEWPMHEMLAAAEQLPSPHVLLDVDDSDLLLPGSMAARINAQRKRHGLAAIGETSSAMPQFASLICHSLAARYAAVLRDAERLTGRRFLRLAIVGGGSLNHFLNRLTAQATGLEIFCGVPEGSTVGNFAIQLATWEGTPNSRERIAHWARMLSELYAC